MKTGQPGQRFYQGPAPSLLEDRIGYARSTFPLNSRVAHAKWGEGLVMHYKGDKLDRPTILAGQLAGEGLVMHYEGDKLTILFDAVGYKTLVVTVVQENQLLQAVTR